MMMSSSNGVSMVTIWPPSCGIGMLAIAVLRDVWPAQGISRHLRRRGRGCAESEQAGRICDAPVNRDLPVNTAWDVGVDDAMAIWCFQVCADHLDVVDYYENHGLGFDHYCKWPDERGYHAQIGCRMMRGSEKPARLVRRRGSKP
ncbi:hypothetical protein [Bradyrhizobium sp. NAS96.2]|uniref:hypothetical protein n=1 Tax=Bradyrhizobium sp. NAS96.2 TaxID=1680160 RepID=UPI00093D00A4|nr:hypothetical protein [Bradyrhizobium sp. NAS96.2]